MSSLYRQQLEAYLKRIDVRAESVLDVGAGSHPIMKRVNSWDVKEYKTLDNDAKFKPDYLKDLNYKIELDRKFDIVFCLEVSEYLFRPLVAIKNLYNFLKNDGILYISFCSIYPLHNPPKIDYLRYTKNAVEKLLKEAGFKDWEITPRIASNGQKSLCSFYFQEQMRFMKGTDEIFDLGYMVRALK